MTIAITAELAFHLEEPTDVLLQFEAAAIPEQRIVSASTVLSKGFAIARVPAQHSIGERIWVRAEGDYLVEYTAEIAPSRIIADLASLDRIDPRNLPGEATEYLFASRYCQSELFQDFTQQTFGHLNGGAKVAAMQDWLFANFRYEPGSSNASTSAVESFQQQCGICRDFAHVLISFARAAAIPARYVSCYAPGVSPQDFHAVAEVFLADPGVQGGGAWHLVDPTRMADPARTVKIGVGRDAADVSFLTVFGKARFDKTQVCAREKST